MDTNSDPRLIRRFTEMLGMIDRGKVEASLNEGLRQALEALKERPDAKGKANIILNVEISMQNDFVQLKPKVSVKLPEGGNFAPLMLWEYEGALSVQHPNQIDMFGGPREVKTAEPTKVAAAE